jgi:hypothetical protein
MMEYIHTVSGWLRVSSETVQNMIVLLEEARRYKKNQLANNNNEEKLPNSEHKRYLNCDHNVAFKQTPDSAIPFFRSFFFSYSIIVAVFFLCPFSFLRIAVKFLRGGRRSICG